MPAVNLEPVAILGLGRFGQSVAMALTREGCEVLALDRNAELVRQMSSHVTLAVEADVTSKDALRQLGVGEYSRAVVAIGDEMEASLLCALVLKEDLGIPEVWAKASNAEQARILRKLGVADVVFPELEVGRRLAHTLVGHRTEYVPTLDGLAYAGVPITDDMIGRALGSISSLAERGILVMGVARSGRSLPELANPGLVLRAHDVLIVCGAEDEVTQMMA